MQMTWSLALTLAGAVAIGPAVASAQLSRPNGSGAAIGHVHINARDIEAQSRFWTTLGGRVIQREKLTLVQFPGIYVIVRKQDPTGGTVGSSLNHFGFLAKDFAASVASWKAAGLDWEPVVNAQVGQGFLNGPDGVRVEIYEDRSITVPMQMHHIHLVVPDPAAAQRWYVDRFGATAGTRLGGIGLPRTQFDTVNVPGTEITLSKSPARLVPTRGRSVDHIGFEVTDIDAFVSKWKAAGINTGGDVKISADASGLRFCYITDPWGTEIEVTEGLATTPAAKP